MTFLTAYLITMVFCLLFTAGICILARRSDENITVGMMIIGIVLSVIPGVNCIMLGLGIIACLVAVWEEPLFAPKKK